MKENNKLLMRMWTMAIISLALASAMILRGVGTNPQYFLIPVIIVILFLLLKRMLNRGLNKALKQSNSSRLINTLVKPLKFIGQQEVKQSYTAYNTALSYVLYGEFEKASLVMNTIDWTAKKPMFQALDANIKSLIGYFSGDISLGISCARNAKALANTNTRFPGAQTSIDTYESFIQIGQVLIGINDNEVMRSLELKFRKLPLLPRLVIAWGLMNGYKQRNELEGYNRMLEFCKTNAPYCYHLQKLITSNAN